MVISTIPNEWIERYEPAGYACKQIVRYHNFRVAVEFINRLYMEGMN